MFLIFLAEKTFFYAIRIRELVEFATCGAFQSSSRTFFGMT